MGLAWQQGPLAPGSVGQFLVPDPLPERLPFAEPLRRRLRARFGGRWIADSERVVLLHEPGRYPVAYFPKADIADGVLRPSEHTSRHKDLGATQWYVVSAGDREVARGAWEHTELAAHASMLRDHVAFAWRAMDAYYEEDERIVGHAADRYHRIDIRQTSRRLVVRDGDRPIADTARPLVLYESGFAPRWYVLRDDVEAAALTPVDAQTFCPYKGICSYYDIGGAHRAAWSYRDAYTEVARVSDLLSFEPDKVTVELDGQRLQLEPGQTVVPHGVDRELTLHELEAA
jgi:uncharacterized protein (DUF427 family)